MIDFVIIIILLLILGSSAAYIYKAKKRGQTCIGCPYAKSCNSYKCSHCSQDKKAD